MPDIVLFYGWSWKVSEKLINKFDCLMLHPSPLPKYRGGSPIQNQIRSCEPGFRRGSAQRDLGVPRENSGRSVVPESPTAIREHNLLGHSGAPREGVLQFAVVAREGIAVLWRNGEDTRKRWKTTLNFRVALRSRLQGDSGFLLKICGAFSRRCVQPSHSWPSPLCHQEHTVAF